MEKKVKKVPLGVENFSEIREKDYFYIDKTDFIREWWEDGSYVTLFARPELLGKTLNLSMLEHFFSTKYAGRGDLFEGLSIWEHEKYREMQGSYPVIRISFASVKKSTYTRARNQICRLLAELYKQHSFLLDTDVLNEREQKFYRRIIAEDMSDVDAHFSLYMLTSWLHGYYEKKVIVLLDDYDTPLIEAHMNGYWEGMASFMTSLFLTTFKTNKYMKRGIIMGITSDWGERLLGDLNMKVVNSTSKCYATAFGFTEKEVFDALEEYGLTGQKDEVKEWYSGKKMP